MAAIWNSPWDINNDWYNKMLASGQYWNDFDLAHASQDQWFADEIFSAKDDYANATTDEARALANARAEDARRKYNYTSGGGGDMYNPFDEPTPTTAVPTPTAGTSSVWGDEMTGNYGKVKDTPSFSYKDFDEPEQFKYDEYKEPEPFQYDDFVAPEPFEYEKYVDDTPDFQHSDAYVKAMDDVLNYGDFAYDYTTDPLYGVYKKEYTREGQRAQADALAQAAAMTGGIPSSYATMAGQQANNYYASKIADKIPELRNQAYNEYLGAYDMLLDKYNTAAKGEEFDYGVYADKKADKYKQYLDDRNMRYDIYRDNYNDAYTRWGDKVNFDYGVYRDQNNDAWNHYINNRDFAYNQYSDDYDRAYNRWRDRTNLDLDIYNTDYSHLMDIYGMAEDNYNRARDEELDYASLLGNYGDMSGLGEYYGDNGELANAYTKWKAEQAAGRGGYGGGGGYSNGGSTPDQNAGNEITYADALGKAMVDGSRDNPQTAYNYLISNWDSLNYQMKQELMTNMGIDPSVAIELRDKGANVFQQYISDSGSLEGNGGSDGDIYDQLFASGAMTEADAYRLTGDKNIAATYAQLIEENAFGNQDPQVNAQSLSEVAAKLGIDNITPEQLAALVAQGSVKKYLHNGQWYFQLTGNAR